MLKVIIGYGLFTETKSSRKESSLQAEMPLKFLPWVPQEHQIRIRSDERD